MEENKVTYRNVMHCENCNDSGILFPVRNDRDTVYQQCHYCDCHQQRVTLMHLQKSGMLESINSMTFESFNATADWQKRMKDVCEKFIKQKDYRFLFIGGQPGSGKTHLGTAVCGHYIRQSIPTRYISFHQLMNTFKANINEEEYQKVLNDYSGTDVLYIDDFMKFPPSQADIKHSFVLIDMRAARHNYTIITSERMLDEITEIDEALGSRIKYRCGSFVLNIARKPDRNHRMNEDEI